MRYKRFIIKRYRGVRQEIVLDVEGTSLIPVIGVNECGKTTILKAIFAFDHTNDVYNEDIRHLQDVHNLYEVGENPTAAAVAAEIELGWGDLKEELDTLEKEDKQGKMKSAISAYRRRKSSYQSSLLIERDLVSKKYSIVAPGFKDSRLNHLLADAIVLRMPYILYFDDFRDSIEETIEIGRAQPGRVAGWIAVIDELFKRVDRSYSVYTLPQMEERRRRSVLAQVRKHLNSTLTRQWQNFRLDDTNALRIDLNYAETDTPAGEKRAYIKLDIVETDEADKEHYFFIRDRSKGFYWFFNFVMKLEFNPKVLDEEVRNAIYLLDEPGSYLHASAQSKLCAKLKQIAGNNTVIYCTHSHYLLDPAIIPVNSIRIADKENGAIRLLRIHEYKGSIEEKHSPFQPILDALQVRPFGLDLMGERVLLTEGIVDYYAFEIFKADRVLRVVPCAGADALKTLISLMIGWRCDYRVLWDNDDAGRESKARAERHFGSAESKDRFYLLPKSTRGRKRILQDLFSGEDLRNVRKNLALPPNTAFDKTIMTLYYSQDRATIVEGLSSDTKQNFTAVFETIGV